MRLALAQINSVVGDIDGNAARVADWLERARAAEADLALFPELVITGYPAEDLLLRPGFVRAARAAVDTVAAATNGITALVGAPLFEDGKLYNACFVLADGEVREVYRKHHLPNYGVFDEDRYFEPGNDQVIVDGVGITVCEDIWIAGPPSSELGEEGEVGLGRAGAVEPVGDSGGVPVDVADDAIDLGQCESHRFSPLSLKP